MHRRVRRARPRPRAHGCAPREGRRRRDPAGGYKSQLPDDDFVPDAIDPDPCKSPDAGRRACPASSSAARSPSSSTSASATACRSRRRRLASPSARGSRSPIAKQFRVIAVFEAGFDQYDSKLVYTDLYEAQAFYEYGDSVTGVEMKVDDIDRAARTSPSGSTARLEQRHLPHDGLARSSTTASSRRSSSSRSA